MLIQRIKSNPIQGEPQKMLTSQTPNHESVENTVSRIINSNEQVHLKKFRTITAQSSQETTDGNTQEKSAQAK